LKVVTGALRPTVRAPLPLKPSSCATAAGLEVGPIRPQRAPGQLNRHTVLDLNLTGAVPISQWGTWAVSVDGRRTAVPAQTRFELPPG